MMWAPWLSLLCAAALLVVGAWKLRAYLKQRRLAREISAAHADRDAHGYCLWRMVRNRKGVIVDIRRVAVRDVMCIADAVPEQHASGTPAIVPPMTSTKPTN